METEETTTPKTPDLNETTENLDPANTATEAEKEGDTPQKEKTSVPKVTKKEQPKEDKPKKLTQTQLFPTEDVQPLTSNDPSLKLLNPAEAVAYIMTQADQKATFRRLLKNQQLASVTKTIVALKEAGVEVQA